MEDSEVLRNHRGQKEAHSIFKELKGKKSQPSIILYSVKISFRKGDKIETVSDNVTLTEFVIDRCTLKE